MVDRAPRCAKDHGGETVTSSIDTNVDAVGSTLTKTELDAIGHRLSGAGVTVAGQLEATLITGGRSNLTFRLDDGRSRWVMRTPPRSGRTPSAHDVAREFRVTRALQDTPVPVARAVLLCEDESVIGGPFAIAEFVDGVSVQTSADLTALDDETIDQLAPTLVATLAALHRIDYRAIGLSDFGRPDAYAERQLRRWGTQWGTVGQPTWNAAAKLLVARLTADLPEQGQATIVHGDFRIDNTLLDLTGAPAVAAVVDWELCTIGDPTADLAMMCAYRNPAFDLIVGGESAWTSDLLPGSSALAASYEQASATTMANWPFHLALAHFKIAVIAAGIDYRFRRGSGTGPGFASAGEAVGPYLEAGLAALQDHR